MDSGHGCALCLIGWSCSTCSTELNPRLLQPPSLPPSLPPSRAFTPSSPPPPSLPPSPFPFPSSRLLPPYFPLSPPPLLCLFDDQIDACLLGNLRNPFVGTVHLLADHPDAAPDTWARRGFHKNTRKAAPPGREPTVAANEPARQGDQGLITIVTSPVAAGDDDDDEPAPVEPHRERRGGNGSISWGVATDWRPPILRGLEADLVGEIA